MTKTIAIQDEIWIRLRRIHDELNHPTMNTTIAYLLYVNDQDTFKKKEGETNGQTI